MQLKSKKILKASLTIIIFIILSNLSPVHTIISLFADNEHYRYSTKNGQFTFTEGSKGWDTAMLYRKFNAYQNETKDSVLYRVFSKNPLAFWRLREYFFDTKYKLPYRNWDIIKKERKDKIELTHWQTF
jgi:hypothetical protein